ncbi:hypothetical protein [Bacillus thuringiensis]|uniref:hypothetical protein n=1 Tax=Bacillus thuringiensis TaxID=1428 RepID=UPI00211D67B2|nr:hypothetical protein [Bacillus thuringiensis]
MTPRNGLTVMHRFQTTFGVGLFQLLESTIRQTRLLRSYIHTYWRMLMVRRTTIVI